MIFLLLKKTGTSSWKEQFTEALTVSGGDDDDDAEADAEGRVSTPSTADYLMHSLTIFWKVLFAFVPPTSKYNFLFHLLNYYRFTFSGSI